MSGSKQNLKEGTLYIQKIDFTTENRRGVLLIARRVLLHPHRVASGAERESNAAFAPSDTVVGGKWRDTEVWTIVAPD